MANHTNVAKLILKVAIENGERDALVFQNGSQIARISFRELWDRASAFAIGLNNAGLNRGDRVITMIPMSIDLYVTLIAVIKMGAVAVFVDPWIPTKQIAKFAEFAEPEAYIGIGKSHLLRWFSPTLRKLPITVTNGRRLFSLPARYGLNQLITANRSKELNTSVADVESDDPALITFTSGSSGIPKGANRTHGFLHSQHLALAKEFPYLEHDIDMPMFPVFALNNLVTGITSIVPDMDFKSVADVDGNTILGQIRQHAVTTITASPPLLDRVADQIARIPKDTQPKLRRLLTGGAPVSNRQLKHWISAFPEKTKIVVAYGSTEAEPVGEILAQDRLSLGDHGNGYCTGHPSSLVDTRIIPITNGPIDLTNATVDELALGKNQIGELVVSGEHVCQDYYKNPGATTENKLIEPSGKLWHRMGDTGYFDEEGRFWLVGRVHSTINLGNKLCHPQLLEQSVLQISPAIEQVAAIGVENNKLTNSVGIIYHSIQEIDSQLIKSKLEQEGHPCDFVIHSNSRLPVDPRHNSKINYTKLRATFIKRLEWL